jgi:hypothetical protein
MVNNNKKNIIFETFYSKSNSNSSKYVIRVSNNQPDSNRAPNVFQDWFSMNDNAILNLQHNQNSNPLYKDIVRKVSKA